MRFVNLNTVFSEQMKKFTYKFQKFNFTNVQGIFWALAVLYKINEKDESLYGKIVMTSYYSDHQSIELAVYGCISMLLTIANVICIQVVGVLILKVIHSIL